MPPTVIRYTRTSPAASGVKLTGQLFGAFPETDPERGNASEKSRFEAKARPANGTADELFANISIQSIVPSAVIYDLGIGNIDWPGESAGREAYKVANDEEFATGNVGAGTGATAGSGASGTKSGLGAASVQVGELRVSAIVVANPMGSILSADGTVLAGQLHRGNLLAPEDVLTNMVRRPFAENTVIGCVVTNAILDKANATKVAQMSHDGIARAVRPAHTTMDGDTLFCASLPKCAIDSDINLVGDLASVAVAHAIRNGALTAVPAYGLPSALSLIR